MKHRRAGDGDEAGSDRAGGRASRASSGPLRPIHARLGASTTGSRARRPGRGARTPRRGPGEPQGPRSAARRRSGGTRATWRDRASLPTPGRARRRGRRRRARRRPAPKAARRQTRQSRIRRHQSLLNRRPSRTIARPSSRAPTSVRPHGSRATAAAAAAMASRARKMRERTVPIGQFIISAISS